MRRLRAIGREVAGLFVDDGWLVGATLVWVVLIGLLVRLAHPAPVLGGGLLFAGLAAILAWSCLRQAGRPR